MAVDWSRVDVTLLDASFYVDTAELLDAVKGNWVVTEGFRHMERSNQLFIDYRLHSGPRAAPGGLSPHNYGMAIDVALDGDEVKSGIQMLWNVKDSRWLGLVNAIWKHPRLRSGKWYNDWPHIEKLHWKDYTKWRQLYEDNLKYLNGIGGLSQYLPKVA